MSVRRNIPDSKSYAGKDRPKATGRVFISYLPEDREVVGRLALALTEAGIIVWLDRNSIRPGSRWQNAIRLGIEQGTYFLACFSARYEQKANSYMDDEIAIAVDELRQYPADQTWFIPVLLDDCQVPDKDIGNGETLRSIQRVSLADDWSAGLRALLSRVSSAKRQPPVAGNPVVFDTTVPMADRCATLVAGWKATGRGADWLVNGKAFFAVCCWMYDRKMDDPENAAYQPDYADYLDAAMGGIGGEDGWDEMLRDHMTCDVCRENYRLENSRLCTSCLKFVCPDAACHVAHSAICFGSLPAEFVG
jgi:hypothetical protein